MILKKTPLLIIAFVILDGLFSSCNYNPVYNYKDELRSDGYFRFSYNGKKVFIPDSIKGGDPSVELLSGQYYRHDSVLSLRASAWPLNEQINIDIQCHDTGNYVLGLSAGSSAEVNSWGTDLLHGGQIHLTQLDTLRGKVAGTFRFEAINKKFTPDSVFVDSGAFFDFPTLIVQ